MLIACEDGRVVELGVSGGRVDFTGLDLHRAVLEQGCFDGGRGAGVSFRNVVALGASFDGADLEGSVLSGALFDVGTVWPDGFDPVAAGAVKVGESRSRFYSESVPRPELFG